jgi:hypothetical protein
MSSDVFRQGYSHALVPVVHHGKCLGIYHEILGISKYHDMRVIVVVRARPLWF